MPAPEAIADILTTFRVGLGSIYGPRLKKIVLVGPWARGLADHDFLIELIVVLSGEVRPGPEIDRMIDLIFMLDIQCGSLVSAVPVSEMDFEKRGSPMLIEARREGVEQ